MIGWGDFREIGDIASGWSATADVYVGEWSFVQEDSQTKAKAKDAVGGQLWLNTPLVGLRVGTGVYRAAMSHLLDRPAESKTIYTGIHGSIEADLDRWRLAAEARSVDASFGSYSSAYVQGGVDVRPRWSLHARFEVSRMKLDTVGDAWISLDGRIDREIDRDIALAVNYEIASAVILKVEGHSNAGLLVEEISVHLSDPAYRTRYVIVSLAASF